MSHQKLYEPEDDDVLKGLKKINKSLAGLIKKTKKKTQMTNIRYKREEIRSTDIKRIIKIWGTTFANKFDNLDEIDTFLERCKLLKLAQEKGENQKSSISITKIELVINSSQKVNFRAK